jgi:exodeoxyribonuclease VII large subunit
MADIAEKKPYSVSSLTAELKRLLEPRFTRIYVEAEISGWRLYPSGHAYFTLKDSGSQISAVMFASAIERCRVASQLKDGAKVVVYGNVSVYAPRGNYQLTVLAAKLVGEGDLMQRYLELKERLTKEGLFDSSRKRPLPPMPRRIGIVTSEAGAVIHDMCTVLTRRFPGVGIRLFPAKVQGADAPESLILGVRYFQSNYDPDLVIVARGGGSFEDLFAFNDEALARAIASSKMPVISAVGHETDFTLADFAADVRAGTPSIAAEIAVPVRSEIEARLGNAALRSAAALRMKGEWCAQRADQLQDQLYSALDRAGSRAANRLAALAPRLETALKLYFERASAKVRQLDTTLRLLSPYSVLERGYSLTLDESGQVVRSASSLAKGGRIRTRFCSGEAVSTVEEIVAEG